MKLERQTAARVLAAAERVRYEHLVKRASSACSPDAEGTARWARACDILLEAARTEPSVQERLLSPVTSDVAKQVITTLLAAAAASEPGVRVTPVEARAAMNLADDVADALDLMRDALQGYARHWLGDVHAAEDIVQQASVKLLAYAAAHPEPMRELLGGPLCPYAYVTVRNLCLDWLRDRPDDESYDQLVVEPGCGPTGGGESSVADDVGRPRFDAAAPWSPIAQFGAGCDGLASLTARCDAVLERWVAEGRVSSRQRAGIAAAVRAVIVKRATGLHHLRDGRYEVWEVLTDREGLRSFGAEILFASGCSGSTLRKIACDRGREIVEAIIAAACSDQHADGDELRCAA